MSTYTTTMTAYPWSQPNIDLENPRFGITVEWTWPADYYWSHFQIVRSIRSPAMRVEEGQRMLPVEGWGRGGWKDTNPDTGNPIFTDPQPPPGEWVYYSLYCLNSNRIWIRAGYVCEIGPADFDWALRLPELIPGVGVNLAQGVAHPSDQDHLLVQFLQVPGTQLDISVTMAEAVQWFWEPLKVPPQLLPALTDTWGFKYGEEIGSGRNRHIMGALRNPTQGSIGSISEVANAAMGSPVDVTISNNLMLDTNDSSFEDPNGSFDTNRWYPKDDVEMVEYYDQIEPPPVLAPNLITGYFIRVHAGTGFPRTFKCGETGVATNGIPVSGWTEFRMGCYGYDDGVAGDDATKASLTMGMDFYDWRERYMGSITAFGPVDLDYRNWGWHGNGDTTDPNADGAVEPRVVPITGLDLEVLPDWKTATNWTPMPEPTYAKQITGSVTWVVDAPDHMNIVWDKAPANIADVAMWGIRVANLESGYTYIVEIEVEEFEITDPTTVERTPWRAAVSDGTATYLSGGHFQASTTEPKTVVSTFEWYADDVVSYKEFTFGVEAQQPSGGWAKASDVRVTKFSVKRKADHLAYGVPWFVVTDQCCLDLIVVDDG